MEVVHELARDVHFVAFGRTIVGLLFLAAAGGKLGAKGEFIKAAVAYRLLPKAAARFIGHLLPWVELIVAAGMLSGILMPWTALVAIGLFLLFASAVAVNLIRGRQHIACGCFGIWQDERLTWVIVVRNAALAGLLAAVAIGHPHSSAQPWPFYSTSDATKQLSAEETAAALFVAVVTVALLWLGNIVLWLWRLPSPEDRNVTHERQGISKAREMA